MYSCLKVFKQNKIKKILKFLLILIFSLSWILFVFKMIFCPYMVPSASMAPDINAGDVIIVKRIDNIGEMKRGDIVAFRLKKDCDINIKRVIGVGGDKISIANGKVTVNSKQLEENYILDMGNRSGEFVVPEGKLFVLGDNRANSWDSSKWINPYLSMDKIEGKVFVKIYPFEQFEIFE